MTDGVFTVNLDRRINTFFKTARQLGLSRSTLWRKIKKRKLSRNH
jgi:transcriptional regulator of acetoin/glycerol metabolism